MPYRSIGQAWAIHAAEQLGTDYPPGDYIAARRHFYAGASFVFDQIQERKRGTARDSMDWDDQARAELIDFDAKVRSGKA